MNSRRRQVTTTRRQKAAEAAYTAATPAHPPAEGPRRTTPPPAGPPRERGPGRRGRGLSPLKILDGQGAGLPLGVLWMWGQMWLVWLPFSAVSNETASLGKQSRCGPQTGPLGNKAKALPLLLETSTLKAAKSAVKEGSSFGLSFSRATGKNSTERERKEKRKKKKKIHQKEEQDKYPQLLWGA